MLETFGRYQLLRKLATGGMGQVYLARQKGPSGFEKILVVKRILPHLSEETEFIQMFFDEARIAALLNHPNIAQIYDLGEVDGVPFIAMEYVHGESVRALNVWANQEAAGVPVPLKCRIMADAAAGLDYAHRAKSPSGRPLGLIHRDVSPQNVLVGYNGNVKVIDFGIAKAANKVSTTLTGAIKGKYAYMSPEQARGEELDHRSDVFGLGIVFYELLTSTRLFKRDTETATLKAVVGARITHPSTLVKGIPKALDQIVLKALARKREDRYQTAGELQLAIEDLLIKLRQPSTSAHLQVFMQTLYKDKLAEEKLRDEVTNAGEGLSPLGHEPSQASRSRSSPSSPSAASASSSASRASNPAGAAGGGAVASGTGAGDKSRSAPSKSGASASNSKSMRDGVPMPRSSDLEMRLRGTTKGDQVRGLFFNALFSAIERAVNPAAAKSVRAVVDPKRKYDDAAPYPTAEFLRTLWKAAEFLAPSLGGAEPAFRALGSVCMESLLRSPSGQDITALGPDEKAFSLPLLTSLEPLMAPGRRTVESSTSRGVSLVFRNDVLPAAFHAGMLARAWARLKGVDPEVDYVHSGSDQFALNVTW